MIEPQLIEINGRQFKKYSHPTYKIRKIGTTEIYNEAVDLLTANYQYELTNEKIDEFD